MASEKNVSKSHTRYTIVNEENGIGKAAVLDFQFPIHSFPFLSVFVKMKSFGASIGKGYPFP